MRVRMDTHCPRALVLVATLLIACRPGASRSPSSPAPAPAPAPEVEVEAEPGPPAPREPEDLAPLLRPIAERMAVPGLGAAVVDREGVVAIGVVGRRRIDQDDPLRIDDRFHLGSDTKAMTAYVVGRLVDRGALAWDDTLASIFPDVKMRKRYRAVTVDQLLTHRAGLPRDAEWDALDEQLDPEGSPAEQRAVVARYALGQRPAQDPGGAFLYSNLGYIVLGAALQERTGHAWEDLMQRELFDPLGMASCGFGPVSTPESPEGNWAHHREGERYEPVDIDNPAYLGPAGTVHCTLEDWGRFAQAMFDDPPGDAPGLEAATLARLRTPVEAEDHSYARGWLVKNVAAMGETIIGHDGSNTVNYASILIAPRRGLALLVVCNAGDPAAQGASVDAMLTLIKRYGKAP